MGERGVGAAGWGRRVPTCCCVLEATVDIGLSNVDSLLEGTGSGMLPEGSTPTEALRDGGDGVESPRQRAAPPIGSCCITDADPVTGSLTAGSLLTGSCCRTGTPLRRDLPGTSPLKGRCSIAEADPVTGRLTAGPPLTGSCCPIGPIESTGA